MGTGQTKWEELGISNDFLFGKVMQNPELCRKLLQRILPGLEIDRIEYPQLQKLANCTGLEIHVSHFPPGTSKWNKIEHKLFCYISKNWEGQPLVDIETVVNLISNTTTSKGLTVQCVVDENKYALHIKISDEEYKKIDIKKDEKLGDRIILYILLSGKNEKLFFSQFLSRVLSRDGSCLGLYFGGKRPACRRPGSSVHGRKSGYEGAIDSFYYFKHII